MYSASNGAGGLQWIEVLCGNRIIRILDLLFNLIFILKVFEKFNKMLKFKLNLVIFNIELLCPQRISGMFYTSNGVNMPNAVSGTYEYI